MRIRWTRCGSICRFATVVLVSLSVTAALASCGWQLRGASGGISLDGQAIEIVDRAGSSELLREVRLAIEGAGGRYVEQVGASGWVLTLHGHGTDSETATVGTDGTAQEYRLRYRIDYGVDDASGETLLARQSIETERRFAAPGGADVRRAREQALAEELRSDAVRLMLLRLQVL